jgi:hypothetical protein
VDAVTVRKIGTATDVHAAASGGVVTRRMARPASSTGGLDRLRAVADSVAGHRVTPFALTGLAFILYLLLGPEQAGTDSHYPIAQAFVHGRLYLDQDYPWLELVPRPGGGWYSPFPPLVSVIMLPFAAVGYEIDTNVVSAVIGALCVGLMWVLLGRLRVERVTKLLLTVGWAFGSELFWISATGGQHLAPQVSGAALLIAALILGIDERWPLLAGLCIGLAVGARLPIGLALPLIMWLQRRDGGWWRVVAGAAVPLAVIAVYNWVRFDSPLEFGYGLIKNVQGESVLSEPWYTHGIDSFYYLPRGIYTMLFSGLEQRDHFPWMAANIGGVSILLTMPVLLWVFEARGPLAMATLGTAILVMLPDLAHGNPGFAQFGYRFILDALPLLWMLLAIAFRNGISRAASIAVLAGVAINVWFSAIYWVDQAGT